MGMGDGMKPHVLAIPHCTQGHITPLVRFCKKLAPMGLTITLVSFEAEIARISAQDPELESIDLRFIGLSRPNVIAKSPKESAELLEKSVQPLKEKLIRDRLSGVPGPCCLVSDFFLMWTQDLATQLSIPRYIFVSSGATLPMILESSEDLFVQGKLRVGDDNRLVSFDGTVDFRGIPPLLYHELAPPCRDQPLHYRQRCISCAEADGYIVNTFYDLEATVIDELRKPSLSTRAKEMKIYPVGPLFPGVASRTSVVRGLEDSQEQSLRWLGSQPESSVLYICFGTLYRLDTVQIKELALALESTKQRFLWVLPVTKVVALDSEVTAPQITSLSDVLPPGFRERVGDLGCIVTGWAPQIQILSHQATGAFLTHCGWNSCLEAVGAGVPMLGWPISADQHVNCRYLVDEVKVAVDVGRRADGFVEQKVVERAVKLVMTDDGRRSRLAKLKVDAAAAVAVGGSSFQALQQFAKDVKNL